MTPRLKPTTTKKTGPVKPVGMSPVDRASTKAANNLTRGIEHINNIYADRKLFLNGLGMVLGYVNDEFDKFMALEPQKPADSGSMFEELFGAIMEIVSVIPPLSLPVKLGKTAKFLIKAGETAVTHAQNGYATAKTAAEAIQKINGLVNPPPDDGTPPPDKGSEAYLREAQLKFPLIQKVISAIYLTEYERRDAIAEYQDEVDRKMDDPTFAGTPLTIATDLVGPAPARKSPDEIYQQFAEIKELLFREIMKAYVKQYAVLAFSDWEDKDFNTHNTYWGLYTGLNEAQWRALIARCGMPTLPLQLRMLQIDESFRGAKASKLLNMLPKYFKDIAIQKLPLDQRLGNPGDLVKWWGARKVTFHNITDWHGLRHTTDWDLNPRR